MGIVTVGGDIKGVNVKVRITSGNGKIAAPMATNVGRIAAKVDNSGMVTPIIGNRVKIPKLLEPPHLKRSDLPKHS